MSSKLHKSHVAGSGQFCHNFYVWEEPEHGLHGTNSVTV